ncbi:hypothetical protein F9C11_40995 [Amycolatopsis sp. VS8301801F10]|uniref:hypothetical protein n=1 Tax=unclassified Amycolatopsis TaxID=2618356 RepID=UPI0038FCDDF6
MAEWSDDISSLMRAEADRCGWLARLLDPLAAGLEEHALPEWTGTGAEAYATVREKQRAQAETAAEAHRVAAAALYRYADAAQSLKNRLLDGEDEPTLLSERGRCADEAAQALDLATERLDELQPTLDALPQQRAVTVERPSAAERPVVLNLPTQTRQPEWDRAQFPVPGGQNPHLQALSDAVLRHFQASIGTISARLEPDR